MPSNERHWCSKGTLRLRVLLIASIPALLSTIAGTAAAQTRRALLIGINRYIYTADIVRRWEANLPPGARRRTTGADTARRDEMANLHGPLNDVEALRTVLIARYQFAAANIRVLPEQEATRDGILTAIHQLVRDAGAGDEVLFYFAGHGSQRFNSLVPPTISVNHLDQTIVPADAIAGQFDIRNVELTEAFDPLLRKGAHLTLIFDSCNSGSAVRGFTSLRARYAPYDPRNARDPSNPQSLTDPSRPEPALFIAASQEDQSAYEDNRTRRGAFSKALVDILANPMTPVNESAERLMQQVEAVLRTTSADQVPVLRGTEGDHERPLFGHLTGPLAGRTLLPLMSVHRDTLVLDGGAALGIGTGSELHLLTDTTDTRAALPSSTLRIRIIAQRDIATSKAVAITGTIGGVRPPALFVLDKWRLPESRRLNVWVPAAMSHAELDAAARALSILRNSSVAEWVSDPTSLPDDGRPLYTVVHDRGGWRLRTPADASIALPSAAASAVESAIQQDQRRISDSIATDVARRKAQSLPAPTPPAQPRLFVDLPPTPEILKAFDDTVGFPLVMRQAPDSARYVLAGHVDAGNRIEYAWISLDAAGQAGRRSPFPPRSDWVSLGGSYPGETLDGYAYGLARVNYWLTVTPQDSTPFPYQLALRRRGVTPPIYKALGDTTPNYGGEQYDLVLRRDANVSIDSVEQQWVYVFIVDRDGLGQLLFGQSQNHMPPDSLGQLDKRTEIPLPRHAAITICPSYGVDTFILVASPTPVSVPAKVFNFPPIRETSRTRRVDPRGDSPDNWSIERLSIVSQPPPAGADALIAIGVAECKTSRDTLLAPDQH